MLISNVQHLQEQGEPNLREALMHSASEGLAPILMTAPSGGARPGADRDGHGEARKRDSSSDGYRHLRVATTFLVAILIFSSLGQFGRSTSTSVVGD